MSIQNVILLAVSAALIIIGIHLSMTQGVGVSYPVFMFAVAFLFWFKYRQNKVEEDRAPEDKWEGKKKR